MFRENDVVKVHTTMPGQFEPSWHRGEVVDKIKDTDTYNVKVEGGPVMKVSASSIKEA